MNTANGELTYDPQEEGRSDVKMDAPLMAPSVLTSLLSNALQLSDLYRCAFRSEPEGDLHQLRKLFHVHHQEQLRLVDLLIDRVRMLEGNPTVEQELLKSRSCPLEVPCRREPRRTLRILFDAHELIISAARP
jgi:hypothetical protein